MKKIILQDNQLNQLVGTVTEKLLEGKTFTNDSITGEKIVGFCKHVQVNNFVLFQIYQDWSAQMQKVQHPFFDYTAPAVKEGLRNFQNTLSSHIKVSAADFKKLLQQAVYNTLKLILNPEDALSNFFFANASVIPLALYRKNSIYFKDFEFAVRSLQRFFEKQDQSNVEKTLFLEKFAKVVGIFEKKNNKSIYAYQKELFLSLTGMDLDQYKIQAPPAAKPAPPVQKTPPPAEKPRNVVTPPPAAKEAESREVPNWIKQEQDRRKHPEDEVTPSTPPVKEATTPVETKQPAVTEAKSTPQEPAAKESLATVNDAPKEKTLAETLKESQSGKQSINDAFNSEENKVEETPASPRPKVASLLQPKGQEQPQAFPVEETVEESTDPDAPRKSTIDLFAQAKKAESAYNDKKTVAETLGNDDKGKSNVNQTHAGKTIRTEQIPVHKQFQYVQKVFGGSSVKFKVVLDKINKTENLEEAESVLNRYVFNDPTVNRNDKVCKEFVGLVIGRFEA